MNIDLKARAKYAEEQKLKKLMDSVQKSIESSSTKDHPLGQDEDFLKTMKYIAKRLDLQILLQIQMIKLLKKK